MTTGARDDDLRGLARSDVLALSSSSFSVLAYYLRPPTAPTLVPVQHVAQFFVADDGSDGQSSKHLGRAARVRPPSNLVFVHRALEAAMARAGAAACAASGSGASVQLHGAAGEGDSAEDDATRLGASLRRVVLGDG